MYPEANVSIIVAATVNPIEHSQLEALRPPFRVPGNISQASTIAKYEAEYPQKWADAATERVHTSTVEAMHLIVYVGDAKIVDELVGPPQARVRLFTDISEHTRQAARLSVKWYGENSRLVQKNLMFAFSHANLLARESGELVGKIDHRLFYAAQHFSLESLLEVGVQPNVDMAYAVSQLLPKGTTPAGQSISGSLLQDARLTEQCFAAVGELPANAETKVARSVIRRVVKKIKG